MVVPASYFGGNSDGALHMENWLDVMCKGCRHGQTEAGLRGMGCELPANAYAAPHEEIAEWELSLDEEFGEPVLTCTKKQVRSRGMKRPPGVGAKHPTLFDPNRGETHE